MKSARNQAVEEFCKWFKDGVDRECGFQFKLDMIPLELKARYEAANEQAHRTEEQCRRAAMDQHRYWNDHNATIPEYTELEKWRIKGEEDNVAAIRKEIEEIRI